MRPAYSPPWKAGLDDAGPDRSGALGGQPALEQVGRGPGVLVARAAEPLGHPGREALVVQDDVDAASEALAQPVGELARLAGLVGVGAAEAQRQADDDRADP